MKGTPLERFWAKVDIEPDGCWVWTAASNGVGYGRFHDGDKLVYPHRWAYERWVGPIPDGMDLDHLCRRRACCNPAHLEAVSRRVNLLRGETLTAAHHEGRDCGFPACRSCKRLRAAA